jgi:hypothetical protein
MMKMVKKKAIPMSTWFGGTCCRDKARLTKSRTIDTRRKLVIRMIMLGARDNTVRMRRSWRLKAISCPVSG